MEASPDLQPVLGLSAESVDPLIVPLLSFGSVTPREAEVNTSRLDSIPKDRCSSRCEEKNRRWRSSTNTGSLAGAEGDVSPCARPGVRFERPHRHQVATTGCHFRLPIRRIRLPNHKFRLPLEVCFPRSGKHPEGPLQGKVREKCFRAEWSIIPRNGMM